MLKSGELFALMAKSRGDSVGKAWFYTKTMLYFFRKIKGIKYEKKKYKKKPIIKAYIFLSKFQ